MSSPALSLLQSVGDIKPYLGFAQLSIGNHEIIIFRLVNNKMYKKGNNSLKKSLLVELKDQVLFLPQYFIQQFNGHEEDKVNEINNDGVKKYLFFGGQRENG